VALEGLENILKAGKQQADATGQPNHYADVVDKSEGLDKIEQLQNHVNNEIYEKAVKILEAYFGLEDEEDASVAPAQVGGQFAFAPAAPAAGQPGFPAAPAGGFNFGPTQ
jgi:hypothetical protein